MTERHQIRDPVHNFLELSDDEMKLVGTPLFQRLRGIRQLAMANLLYPGALHTRFDHSLGVCHVAGLLARQLDLNWISQADQLLPAVGAGRSLGVVLLGKDVWALDVA